MSHIIRINPEFIYALICTVYAQNAHYDCISKKIEVMSKNGFQIWIQHPQIR